MNVNDLDQILTRAAAALDIPDDAYEDAVLKYESVGEWLASDDSELKDFSPEIYPQGSFRLGTVVHPLAVYDYDIDLVCVLNLTKDDGSQKELKDLIGKQLKRNVELKPHVSPGCRCWLVDYPPESDLPGFHMDVLPSIPNPEQRPTGIFLTDTELFHWQKSNPKAYSSWFYSRMAPILLEKRAAAANSAKVNIEDVPEWRIKTPLQMAVQLLKRHRDIYFQPVPDDRPVSIIVTTLAALAYRGQSSLYNALLDVMTDMPKFIERKADKWWITNPTEADENFADRWNEHPQRSNNFFTWLKRAQEDFSRLGATGRLEEVFQILNTSLGREVTATVMRDLGFSQSQKDLKVPRAIPGLGDTSHRLHAPWPRYKSYIADIRASVYLKQNRRRLWPLANRPIPKNLWIRFEVTTNTPPPYEVVWQVVNTGKEAAEAGKLRGGFEKDGSDKNRVRWETTLYRGTHWVQAFVVKNGVMVAEANPQLVKIR
jgi:hypothetical protein